MKRSRTSRKLGLVVFAAMAGPFAMADDSAWHWYAGINGGQSRAKIDDVRIKSGLLAGGFTTTSIVDSDRPSGYKAFGGFQLNKFIALEGGYFDLGQFGFVATTVPAGTFSGTIKVKGVNLDLVGTLPITEKFSAFGRAGVNRAQAKDIFAGTGLVRVLNPNPSVRETHYKIGVGLQYAITPSFDLRAEVERYRINDAVGNLGDIDLVSVGVVYRFGRKTPAAARVLIATAPEPVAPAPRAAAPDPVAVAPAPQPAAVIPPPSSQRKVTFSADALFDFDKATIKPAGKQALDKFAVDLRGTKYDVITVTGYTDRIGSDAYNMALSTRRAAAVKTYLVEPAGIPAGKIAARGVGESGPVTKPGECKGKNATKSLIACLQPDRRVEVEVAGTK